MSSNLCVCLSCLCVTTLIWPWICVAPHFSPLSFSSFPHKRFTQFSLSKLHSQSIFPHSLSRSFPTAFFPLSLQHFAHFSLSEPLFHSPRSHFPLSFTSFNSSNLISSLTFPLTAFTHFISSRHTLNSSFPSLSPPRHFSQLALSKLPTFFSLSLTHTWHIQCLWKTSYHPIYFFPPFPFHARHTLHFIRPIYLSPLFPHISPNRYLASTYDTSVHHSHVFCSCVSFTLPPRTRHTPHSA